jgi:hypothetical protein
MRLSAVSEAEPSLVDAGKARILGRALDSRGVAAESFARFARMRLSAVSEAEPSLVDAGKARILGRALDSRGGSSEKIP